MGETIFWASCNIPTSTVRDRNLSLSCVRAHAARVSHQRRKSAAKETVAKKREPSKIESRVQVIVFDANPAKIVRPEKDGHRIMQLLEDHTGLQNYGFSPGQSAYLPQLTHAPDVLSAVFEEPYQRKSFNVWLREVSPHKVRYGFQYEELFTRIMPQLCMTSPALRHMILAQSLHYQQRKISPATVQNRPLVTCSLYHYVKALEIMRQARLPNKELLAAICIASILENNQDNDSGSMRHVKGYKEILQIYQGKYDEDYQAIRGCYSVLKVYHDLANLGKLPDDRSEPWSIETARDEMKKILCSVVDPNTWKEPLNVFRLKVALGQWYNTERDWYRIHDTSINREALLLLLPFAVSLMPEDEVNELSGVVEPRQVVYLLSAAESVLDRGRKLDVKDRNQLSETLELLAFSTIRYVKDVSCLKAATNLLRKTMGQSGTTGKIEESHTVTASTTGSLQANNALREFSIHSKSSP